MTDGRAPTAVKPYNDAVRTRIGLATSVSILAAAVLAAAQSAAPLTDEAKRDFLLTAKVIASRPAGKGITGVLRLTLSDGVITHDAGFQSIDERLTPADRVRGRRRAGELNFVDSYKYNIAAYEIAKLLALDHMMPVTVERRLDRKVGSLSWWVDDVLMDEVEREASKAQPPSPLAVARQRQVMGVFTELVRDVDRNKGNILYTKDWRLVMIDFTRAFRLDRSLRDPDTLQQCDRGLFMRLQALSEADVKRVAQNLLTSLEIAGVMARRQLIVDRFAQLIRDRGENVVLYDLGSGM